MHVNNQISLLHIVTHCDKKPCGKVGGSAISVYQALLHPPIESLGTRLLHVPNMHYMLSQAVTSFYSSNSLHHVAQFLIDFIPHDCNGVQ